MVEDGSNREKQRRIIEKAIRSRIQDQFPLQFMTFSGTDIDAEGLELFLDYDIDVRELFLMQSKITDEAMIHVNRFPHLEELNIEQTDVTPKGLRSWTPPPCFRSLSLNYTALEPDGWEHLASFTTLTELVISHVYRDPFIRYDRPALHPPIDYGLQQLSTLRSLRYLAIIDRDIVGTGLICIKGMPHLESIVLDNTRVPADALRILSTCRRLKSLGLSNTGVDDEVLIELADALDIEDIGLANSKVTDRGILHLASKGKLKSIFAEDVSWSKASCEALLSLPTLEWAELEIEGVEHDYLEDLAEKQGKVWLHPK